MKKPSPVRALNPDLHQGEIQLIVCVKVDMRSATGAGTHFHTRRRSVGFPTADVCPILDNDEEGAFARVI